MRPAHQIKAILVKSFSDRHVSATLKHFSEAVEKYQEGNWEVSLSKIGKFVEAVLKALWIYCGQTLPPARNFKAGQIIRNLGNLSSSQYSDSVRLLVPRGCAFVYDITSNRGARHDPDEIDPNKMDASVALSSASWILSEMLRLADSSSSNPEMTAEIVEALIEKKYPFLENIDGRTYVNIAGLSAKDIGLLLLNAFYPGRISRTELIGLIKRHGFTKGAAAVSVTRLQQFVDDDGTGAWKLRGLGRQAASALLSNLGNH
jgi:hypothetical protein